MRAMSSRTFSMRGFSLIELMIALLLGLIVIGGAISLFASNRAASRSTEGLSRLQENTRAGYEMMTRDIREAASSVCGKNIPIANVLNGYAGDWRYDWGDGIQGFDSSGPGGLPGVAPGKQIAGTDALVLHSAVNSGVSITEHNPNAANFKVNTKQHGLQDGDIAIVCDFEQVAIFQVTNANPNNVTIVHNTGGAVSPGNCTKGLGLPVKCTANGTSYSFRKNGTLAKLSSVAWYLGDNGRGGSSLYRKDGAKAPDEISENVTDLQFSYLSEGTATYVTAAVVPDWKKVTAVRVQFKAESPERVGTDTKTLQREVAYFVALRNRNQ